MTGARPVVRDEFATDDPELAEDMVRRLYVDQRLSISGRPTDFTFGHQTTAVAGPGSFAINRMRHTLTVRFAAVPMEDLVVVDAVRRGSLHICESPTFDDIVAGPDEVMLAPVTGHYTSQLYYLDVDITALSHRQVAAHAAARTGIDPTALRFTGKAPLTPALGALWIATIAHVRDDILADPELTAIPTLLDGAFQTLATSVLATFPNTALDAVNDPDAPAPGHVSDAATRHVLDHLHEHAAEPLGPADVAAIAGAPARDVDDALRRTRNTTLAEQWWQARMQGAYRDLYDGDTAAGDTVAAIAARWGFTDPATFTIAYTHASGGETPGDTLRR